MSSPDSELLKPADPPFSPLTMFVCTYEARIGNMINLTHAELIKRIEPLGAIKALNCNFGHKVQPGFERFEKRPKPPAEDKPVNEPRGRFGPAARGNDRPLAAAHTRTRKPQGDSTCFNSALEVTIIPGPEDDPPPAVREYLALNPSKHYAVKSFPTTGQTQVPGVVCAGLEDGAFIAQLWAKFLTEANLADDAGAPVSVVTQRPIMLNFKFFLHRHSDRVILNLSAIAKHLEAIKETGEGLPFPVREIKHVQDGQNISFKFERPSGKKIRVNVFFRGKVNILGANDFEAPGMIYGFLEKLVVDRWDTFVSIQPLPDSVRRTTAVVPTPQAIVPTTPLPPPDLTVSPENVLADDDLYALLCDLEDAEKEAPPESPAIDLATLLSMARGFEDDFGVSDNIPLDHVQRQDVEDD